MRALLDLLAGLTTRRPRAVIGVLVAVTLGFAALVPGNEFEVDLTQVAGATSTSAEVMDRIREEFADPTASVQVIVDAGPDGDVLTGPGLQAVAVAERAALDALGEEARSHSDGEPAVRSLWTALNEAVAQRSTSASATDANEPGTDALASPEPAPGAPGMGAPTPEQLSDLAGGTLAGNPQLAALLSDDADPAAGTARATVVLLPLAEGLTDDERADAAQRVRSAIEDVQGEFPDGVEATVHSSELLSDGLLDAIRAEVPQLFGLALLVVLALLGLTYRSVFDVAIAATGLLATVVWTFGIAALLGPAFLGWTGPLTQLTVIVPVLLVGLGVDYGVHLTARYREQRAHGQDPTPSAAAAVQRVGVALAIATVATAVGFASIAIAPLSMLADFGVFVAIGVVCAWLVMGLLVPAARVWRDRRGARPTLTVRDPVPAWLLSGPTQLAQRAPRAGLLTATVLVVLSLVAASTLEVRFDRDDFIPDGSEVAADVAQQDELFGGGLAEQTFVVVDGELTQRSVLTALADAHERLSTVDGVRMVGGRPQVLSVFTLAATADGSGVGSSAPELPSPEAVMQLREQLGPDQLASFLADDRNATLVQIRTTVGDAGAEALRDEVLAVFGPVADAGAEVTVTSEPLIMAEMSRELSAFQVRSILLTLTVVMLLLIGFYTVSYRRPTLGLVAMIPAVVGAALVLGVMWLLGVAFNVLTATLTAIAIGIGVPYGVHIANRFVEDLSSEHVDDAVASTLGRTGGALVGSAITTLGAFAVLAWSGLPPIRSLGLLGGAGIAVALLAALLVQPGALVLWARRRRCAERR